MQRIRIGTAAWADRELIDSGLYFPPDCKSPEERLRYYAQEFPLVEVDSSYYAIPAPRTAQQWADRTPVDFVFDIKAFRLLTSHPTEAKVLSPELRAALPETVKAKRRFYYHTVRFLIWHLATFRLKSTIRFIPPIMGL